MKGRDTCVEEAALDCTRTTPKHTVSEPPKQMFNIEMCKRFREREFGFRHRERFGLNDGDINTEGTGLVGEGSWPARMAATCAWGEGAGVTCAALHPAGELLQALPRWDSTRGFCTPWYCLAGFTRIRGISGFHGALYSGESTKVLINRIRPLFHANPAFSLHIKFWFSYCCSLHSLKCSLDVFDKLGRSFR